MANGISRRRMMAAIGGASAGAALLGAPHLFANELSSSHDPLPNNMSASFGALKQIDAGLLNVSYVEAGPVSGKPVIILHGWPYDIHSFVDVTSLLAANGHCLFV